MYTVEISQLTGPSWARVARTNYEAWAIETAELWASQGKFARVRWVSRGDLLAGR